MFRSFSIGEDKRERLFLATLLLMSLALRIVNFVLNRNNPLMHHPINDEAFYIGWANFIRDGHWMGDASVFFMDPLYAYFLAMLFSFFGENLDLIKLTQILADSLNSVLIYFIGKKIFSRQTGEIASIIYCLYKVSFFYTLLILKPILALSFALLAIYMLLTAKETPLRWICIGIIVGLSSILRANNSLLVLLIPTGIMLIHRDRFAVNLKKIGLFLLGASIILLTSGARNYFKGGEFILLTSQMGRALYISNNPDNMSGMCIIPSFARWDPYNLEIDFHREAERRNNKIMTSREVSQYWRSQTLKFILSEPGKGLKILWNKLRLTYQDAEIPNNYSFDFSKRFSYILKLPLPTFAIILGLGIPGIILSYKKHPLSIWLLLFGMVPMATIFMFYTSSRFRFSLAPLLILFSGYTLWWIKNNLSKLKWIGILSILAGSILITGSSIYFREPTFDAHGYFLTAKAYKAKGLYGKANKEIDEGIKLAPRMALYWDMKGLILMEINTGIMAEKMFRKALSLDAKYSEAWYNLGIIYYKRGAHLEAVKNLKKAISLKGFPKYYLALSQAYSSMGKQDLAEKYYRIYQQTKIK